MPNGAWPRAERFAALGAPVSFEPGLSESRFVFDEASGALVGARAMSDLPFGPCRAPAYIGGTFPDGPCSTVETCEFCATNGEAGAGGAAGAGDGPLCP